jgi:hypothetical protein
VIRFLAALSKLDSMDLFHENDLHDAAVILARKGRVKIENAIIDD